MTAGMRRRARLATLLCGLLLLVVAAPGAAAQQATDALEITGIDLSEFPDVTLRVAVSGAAAGATSGDLRITENGAVVDADISPLSGETIGVVLAIDTSGSMEGEAMAGAKAAAGQLLDELPVDAVVSVIDFDDTAEVVSDFTIDRDGTRAAIDALVADGGTALFDAVVLGAGEAADAPVDRAALVVLTDGRDANSQAGIGAANSALAGFDGNFYAVALQSDETDVTSLQTLADTADGRVVPAADPEALAAAYVDLGQRIANQFAVTFTSVTPDPTGTFGVTVSGVEQGVSVEIALPERPTESTAPTTQAPAQEGALPEPLVFESDPGLLQQDWVLFAGAALVGLAIALTVFLVGPGTSDRPERRSLRSDAEPTEAEGEGAVAVVRRAAADFTSRAVERADVGGPIDNALDRAGIVMRAGEFVATVIAVALAAGVLGWLLLGVFGGILGLLVPLFGAKAFLDFMAGRRNAKFASQLSDTLLVMSGALRSGFGVAQAIDTVAEEMDPPMSAEFRRAILETRLGRDIEDALDAVARRVQNEDFEWVVDAMRINHQVGGDLASILDQVSETIRARNRLKRQVDALTAEGRISALVLTVLPAAIGLLLYSSNPDYMDPLFNRTVGQIMLGGGILLLVAGALWLKKLIDIEY